MPESEAESVKTMACESGDPEGCHQQRPIPIKCN